MMRAVNKNERHTPGTRATESPFIQGQRVSLCDWQGVVIEEVTVSDVLPNIEQCQVIRRNGTKELVSERRLRA